MKDKQNICVITGSRAEYGLLKHLIDEIKISKMFKMTLIATGSHLSDKYGNTIKEVESNNHFVDRKINISLEDNTKNSINKSIANGIIGFSEAFESLDPDIVIILGDRFEILSAAIAAMVLNIPIAHIHGGEITEGAIDDSIRHSLTKFSHLHFVAAEEYKKRVIQLGENPNRVFNVGALGIDGIHNTKLLTKKHFTQKHFQR